MRSVAPALSSRSQSPSRKGHVLGVLAAAALALLAACSSSSSTSPTGDPGNSAPGCAATSCAEGCCSGWVCGSSGLCVQPVLTTSCAALSACCANLGAAESACESAAMSNSPNTCQLELMAYQSSGLCGGAPEPGPTDGGGGRDVQSDLDTGTTSGDAGGGTTYPQCAAYAARSCGCLGSAADPNCVATVTSECNDDYPTFASFYACYLAASNCESATQCIMADD
jgi:hypothetical protein